MAMNDIHSGHRQRLRQRYINDGLDSFEDHQILELILFYSVARKDTNELAHRLLDKFGSLARVLDAKPEELEQVEGIGSNSAVLLSMMPGMGAKMGDIESMIDEKQLARMEAIVLSMTPAERKNPKLLNPSRKHRIAKGAGVDIAVVNRFVKQFEQSQKMMKQMSGMMGKKGRRMRFPF